MAYFLKLLGARPVRLRIEPGKVFVIGRSADSDLVLEDKLVSRRHCELDLLERGLEVRDLGSRNGTFLNGRRIERKAFARPGDQVRVGSSFLLVESENKEGRGEAEDRERQVAGPVGGESVPPPARGSAQPAGRQEAQAASPLPPSLPGYEVVCELWRTRTGRIYRARSLLDGREVALKVLEVEPSNAEAAVQRFGREARALQKLDHPNVVRILDVGRVGSLYYYATEFVEGGNLASRLKKGPLGVREALSVALQVARALELAHAEQVIHRDVAPESILLSPSGVAKLSDFGFVKDAGAEGHSLTNLGEIVGDLVYSSPEQVRDPRMVDARTDLYALGATLFHAISGRPPFEGANYLETLRKVLSLPAPSLSELVPEVPAKVEKVVARLLEKDPAKRFATASDAIRALEDALLEACGPGSGAEAEQGVLSGGFSGTELAEIVQFLEANRKDGTLVVSAPPLEGEMVFRQGEIVWAEAGQLEGEVAVQALLGASGGTFRFRAADRRTVARDTGLHLRPSALAVLALRARDEKSREMRR